MKLPARGLYAITSDAICASEDRLCVAVQAAIRGGAVMIQYRDKINPAATQARHVLALKTLCDAAGVPLILNDGPPTRAVAWDVAGVHLGLDDGDLAEARRTGVGRILGATCGRSLVRAQAAVAAGADYVAFGAFYPSRTKPGALPAPLELLREAKRALTVPICAIGGITPDNAPVLIDAGADYIAAIGGVFDAPDIALAARRYACLFGRSP